VLAASSKSQSGVPDVRNWVGAMNKKGPQYFKELYADAVKKAKDRAEEERKKRVLLNANLISVQLSRA
jgi:hypothetical protein